MRLPLQSRSGGDSPERGRNDGFAPTMLRPVDPPLWIAVLLTQLEAHEPGSTARAQRVAELAARLGSRIGLSSERMQELQYAALVCEVGRTAVPVTVLRKPGPLNPAEQRIMRMRNGIGECTVRVTGARYGLDLSGIATVVRSAQERWDGSGYPDGLAGDAIPLASRILHLCNAYRTMVDGARHREPCSLAKAHDELEESAGTDFDPALVRMMVAAPDHPISERTLVSPGRLAALADGSSAA